MSSISVLGAYFPDWLFCIVAGVAFAIIVYLILKRLQVNHPLWSQPWCIPQLDHSPRTDDAYAYADTIDVVPEVNGRIVELAVRDRCGHRLAQGPMVCPPLSPLREPVRTCTRSVA